MTWLLRVMAITILVTLVTGALIERYTANLVLDRRDATPCWTTQEIWDEFDHRDEVDDRFGKSERPVCDDAGQFVARGGEHAGEK